MRVEAKQIEHIKPNPRNARKHSAKQKRQIADSIVAFGFTNPLLVSEDGELIAGHGRYEAAKLLPNSRRCLSSLSPDYHQRNDVPLRSPTTKSQKMQSGIASALQTKFRN